MICDDDGLGPSAILNYLGYLYLPNVKSVMTGESIGDIGILILFFGEFLKQISNHVGFSVCQWEGLFCQLCFETVARFKG